MQLQNVTIIKLGGSVITDKTKPYTSRPDTIRQLAKEIKTIKTPLIIVHGSGSFGHTSAKLYGGSKDYKSRSGIAKVSYDAMHINQIVMEIFLQEGLPVIALHPRSMILTQNGTVKQHLLMIVIELLTQNLIPVLYGDVLWDTSWKTTIFSGEKVIIQLTTYFKQQNINIGKVIFAGDTDGVFDLDEKTIPIINSCTWQAKLKNQFAQAANDVTGGMKHKVEQSLLLATMHIPVLIINGLRKKELINAYLGEQTSGTTIQ